MIDKDDVSDRIRSCSKAFYSLQGAGLCYQGLPVETAMHVWSATCKPIFFMAVKLYILVKPIKMN